MIKIKDNGEIDVKELNKEELSVLVDMRLDYYKEKLNQCSFDERRELK